MNRKLSDDDRDDILIYLKANFDLWSKQLQSFGTTLEEHGKRIEKLENEVLVGVHHVDPLIPSHLSPPPPPMRAPMDTRESIRVLAIETAKQTPMIEQSARDSAKAALATKRNEVANFVGLILAAMIIALANNCQTPRFGARPVAAPPAAVAPAQTPSPSPSGTRRRSDALPLMIDR